MPLNSLGAWKICKIASLASLKINPKIWKTRAFLEVAGFLLGLLLLFFYPYHADHQADEAGGEVGVGDTGPNSNGQDDKSKA